MSLYVADTEDARTDCLSFSPELSFCAWCLFERVLASKSGKEKNKLRNDRILLFIKQPMAEH